MALPPPAPSSTALITGASSGIGADIARELAARGHGVTLAARREDRLRDLAAELERDHGVRAEVVATDLSEPTGRAQLVAALEQRELTVEVLVNNAGFGSAGSFEDLDQDTERRMVRTNVDALHELCTLYVPPMARRGRGAVLNVASTAGFQPLPRQATYTATKAFVLTFTEVLHSDLLGTGVTATALCPGPVKTEFIEVAKVEAAAESAPEFMFMSSEETAKAGVAGLEKGKRVVVPGAVNRIGALSGQHAPRSVLLSVARRFYPMGK